MKFEFWGWGITMRRRGEREKECREGRKKGKSPLVLMDQQCEEQK